MITSVKEYPKVSIITVVYNGDRYIEATIQSVLNQAYSNFEFIIIDGGSTDRTVEIIKGFGDRIQFWISEPDKGIYDAMNKGILASTGEWLNFMNAGDRFSDNLVLFNIFTSSITSKIDFIYSDWFVCDFLDKPSNLFPVKGSFADGIILHQSVIYKRKLHYEYGFYLVTPELIVSDYLFFNLIPIDTTLKSNFPISINDRNGVSTNQIFFYQKFAVDYLFKRISIEKLTIVFLVTILKNYVKKILIR